METFFMSSCRSSATRSRSSPAMGTILGRCITRTQSMLRSCSRRARPPEGGLEEDGGVCAFPFRIARREEGSDVSGGDGAEEGVGDGVEKQVTVGVTGEAFGVVDFEAANDQWNSGLEGVRVKAETDPDRHSANRKSKFWEGPPPPATFCAKSSIERL